MRALTDSAAVIGTTGPRVLVVAGDGVIRAGLRVLLEQHGCAVAVERSSAAALRRVTSFAPEVILVDADVPSRSTSRATRRLVRSTAAAMLVLAGSARDTRVRSAVRARASGVWLKDAPLIDLVDAVRAAAAGQPALDLRVAETLIAAAR